ncbi:transglycosylase SLT domain-containing protein [Sulfuriflexus mobilis]|uniref:transglycosylase SLT domain-containing protein n=1 Tax=Sulfuriflexus mobilis TaxID=1811807 RepID=UPI000F830C53|nr:transglycosylase SLT domain-containing protein [Sulfuriflexus mobilis]
MRLTCLVLTGWLFSHTGWAAEQRVDSDTWSRQYDHHFKKYTKRYFGPFYDWHWFKAQGIAESHLKATAESHRGAVGLMQILPSTYAEIKEKNPYFKDIQSPRWNIAAGIFYDRELYRRWQDLPEQERLYLAFASYNAGYGRIRRDYKRAPGPVSSWQHIEPYIPLETQNYVSRIRELKDAEERLPPRWQKQRFTAN